MSPRGFEKTDLRSMSQGGCLIKVQPLYLHVLFFRMIRCFFLQVYVRRPDHFLLIPLLSQKGPFVDNIFVPRTGRRSLGREKIGVVCCCPEITIFAWFLSISGSNFYRILGRFLRRISIQFLAILCVNFWVKFLYNFWPIFWAKFLYNFRSIEISGFQQTTPIFSLPNDPPACC